MRPPSDLVRPPASPPGRNPRRFDRPVFVVGSPRSRTSMVFEALARSPDAWTVGGESHAIIEAIPSLHPAARAWDSNRLDAADATPATVAALHEGFARNLRDRHGASPGAGTGGLRLVEKTPKNSLRVPFLAAAFPDALFVHLHREPSETLASMAEAWRTGGFVTYPDLPGWPGRPWSLLLVPGWRELRGRPLEEIVAAQWRGAVGVLLDDLAAVDAARVLSVDTADFVTAPATAVARVCTFAGLAYDEDVSGGLPHAAHIVSPPAPGKWRAREAALAPHLTDLEPLAARARARCG